MRQRRSSGKEGGLQKQTQDKSSRTCVLVSSPDCKGCCAVRLYLVSAIFRTSGFWNETLRGFSSDGVGVKFYVRRICFLYHFKSGNIISFSLLRPNLRVREGWGILRAWSVRNAYAILVGKSNGRLLGRISKTEIGSRERSSTDWILLVQDSDRWRALLNMVNNLRVSLNVLLASFMELVCHLVTVSCETS